ncbi:hypothetical protein [Streptosporangium saharense]|uniref:hypothetical protein n=1 Tax=Streptosporangium saharense TaxID=1706840 RepID=UPI00343D2166
MSTTPCPDWCTGHEHGGDSHAAPATRLKTRRGTITVTPFLTEDGQHLVVLTGLSVDGVRQSVLAPADAADLGEVLTMGRRDLKLGRALIAAAAVLTGEEEA